MAGAGEGDGEGEGAGEGERDGEASADGVVVVPQVAGPHAAKSKTATISRTPIAGLYAVRSLGATGVAAAINWLEI
jgi:hypothetical protein